MIRVENLTVQAGDFRLARVSFEVPTGRYGILMGQTGSGKTTVLESLCGLKKVTEGRIVLMGRDVTATKPAERGVGFVPQEAALFPTMTVGQQLAFALAIRKWSAAAIRERVETLAEMLGIGDLLDRIPKGLSGGERQRVALGRALSFRPSILCLDEPLSALDESTRESMCELLASVTKQTGVTTMHITHSPTEAERLGDCVFQIQAGKLLQLDKQPEVTAPSIAVG